MPKMSEIRAKFPQYDDLPDEQLVIGLHRKYYKDMPFKDFNGKIEYDTNRPDPTEGMSGFDKFAAGVGKSVYDVGRSAQRLNPFSDYDAAAAAEDERRDAPLMNTGAGTAGKIVGDIATTFLPAGAAAKGANVLTKTLGAAKGAPSVVAAAPFVGATAGGALSGAMTSPSDMTEGAALGAGFGAGGEVLSRAMGAVRQGAKPTEDALLLQREMNSSAKAGDPPVPKLTVGQLAPEGGWLRKAEDAVANTPLVGHLLRERQSDAQRGYQTASRLLGKPANVANTEARTVESIRATFNDTYESMLKGQQIPTGRDSMTNANVFTPAKVLQQQEAQMKQDAISMMTSKSLEEKQAGRVLMAQAEEFGSAWRSKLPDDVRNALTHVDQAYARFIPIDLASKKSANALVIPEQYTPKDVLRASRKLTNAGAKEQKELARLAERVIGSRKPATSIPATIGGSVLGAGAVLAGEPLTAATAAALGSAYGTRAGQAVGRRLQRELTRDNVAAYLDALRKGMPAAFAGGTKDE